MYKRQLRKLPIDNSKKNELLRQQAIAGSIFLTEQEDFEGAMKLLDDATNYDVTGKGGLLGAGANAVSFREAKNAVRYAQDKADDDFSDRTKSVGNGLQVLLEDITSPTTTLEEVKSSFETVLNRAGVPEEEVTKYLNNLNNKNVQEFRDIFQDAIREQKEGSTTRALLEDNSLLIKKTIKEHHSASALVLGTFTEEEMDKLFERRQEAILNNPNVSLTSLPVSIDGRKVYTQDPMYLRRLEIESRGRAWATSPASPFKSIVKEGTALIVEDEGDLFGDLSAEYQGTLLTELNKRAPRLFQQSGEDLSIFSQALQQEATKLIDEFGSEANLRNNLDEAILGSLKKKLSNPTAATDEEIEVVTETERRSFGGFMSGEEKPLKYEKYNTFFLNNAAPNDIRKDRQELINDASIDEDDKKLLIRRHLRAWGFQSVDDIDIDLMNRIGIGFYDIPFQDSLLAEMNPATEYYMSLEEGKEPTPEMVKAKEQFEKIGFDSLDDFSEIKQIQDMRRAK